MSRAVLVLVFLSACAIGIPAAETDTSEAAAKAAEAFESLYGKEFKRVRTTADARDDIDLAKRLIGAAKEVKDPPEFVTVLCEKACELASVPSGYATAVEALQLLASTVPAKSDACAAKIIEIRQKQYDAAKGEDRMKAGETLLDVLLTVADAKEKEGTTVEPAALLKRALTVATAVKSDRWTEIETHLRAMEQAAKTLREIEDLEKQLEADPQKVAAREKLVRLLLVDRDDPAEAAKWIEGAADKALKKYVPAGAKPLLEAPDLACREMGDWYRDLADQGTTPAIKGAMLRRAWAYYQRFMEVHTGDDLAKATARITLKGIEEDLVKLGPTGAKPGTPGIWLDCLALVDPAKDAVKGVWKRQGEALESGSGSLMTVPVVPSGSYELEARFIRTSGNDTVAFILPVGSGGVAMTLGFLRGAASGLALVRGKEPQDNESGVKPGNFENGREHVLQVKVAVQADRVQLTSTLDGKAFVRWQGPVADLSVIGWFRLPQPGCLGLSVSEASAVFRRLQLRMISGEAKILRPAAQPVSAEKSVPAEKTPSKDKAAKEKP